MEAMTLADVRKLEEEGQRDYQQMAAGLKNVPDKGAFPYPKGSARLKFYTSGFVTASENPDITKRAK